LGIEGANANKLPARNPGYPVLNPQIEPLRQRRAIPTVDQRLGPHKSDYDEGQAFIASILHYRYFFFVRLRKILQRPDVMMKGEPVKWSLSANVGIGGCASPI
jgi:hypothetical protein